MSIPESDCDNVKSYVGRLRSTFQLGLISLMLLGCFRVSQQNPWIQLVPPTIKLSLDETMACSGLLLTDIVLIGERKSCTSSFV